MKDDFTNAYSPLPVFLTNPADLNFDVFTNDPLTVGRYIISIHAKVPDEFMNPTYEEELLIELTVLNSCITDSVSPLSSIPNQLYYIAEDGR